MQTCSVILALGGDITKTIQVDSVTPAEALVLMRLHGRESVTRMAGTTDEKNVSHAQVIQGLAVTYGPLAVEDVFGKQLYNVQLPTRLADIQLSIESEDTPAAEEDPAPKKTRKGKSVVDLEPVIEEPVVAEKAAPVEA